MHGEGSGNEAQMGRIYLVEPGKIAERACANTPEEFRARWRAWAASFQFCYFSLKKSLRRGCRYIGRRE